MFNILGMLIVGLIAGALARWIFPGDVALGFWMTMLLGIAGSFFGGFLVRLVNKPRDGRMVDRAGLIMSVIGSVLLLAVGRQFHWW